MRPLKCNLAPLGVRAGKCSWTQPYKGFKTPDTCARWQKAINAIISSARMVENVQILNDQYADGAER